MSDPTVAEISMEHFDEWRVTGAHNDVNGGPFDYVYDTPDLKYKHTAEQQARNMIRLLQHVEQNNGPQLVDGPHLFRRSVSRSDWVSPDPETSVVITGDTEAFTEWRVTGEPGPGYPSYTFVYSPDRNPRLGDPETAAREAMNVPIPWTAGPHLSMRWVVRGPWTPFSEDHHLSR